jgi:prepilin signal peptidase PulO-like enzyme (type II secretory pathway)
MSNYNDPFDDQVRKDPFEDDHFANRQSTSQSTDADGAISVPNASGVLALGIMSIVGAFCYGIVGLIFAIMALAIAAAPNREYQRNPDRYTAASYSNLKAGRICGIIGLILSIGMLLLFAIAFLFVASNSRGPMFY